jgi:acetate kinase
MFILVMNCGSSSIKADIIDTGLSKSVLALDVEKISSIPIATINNIPFEIQSQSSFDDILDIVFEKLKSTLDGIKLEGIAHRVVHGGDFFTHPTKVNEQVIDVIQKLARLAPLHNPINLKGILSAQKHFPELENVAVFDTAFHQTLPSRAKTYAIDQNLASKHGLKRYGFHGTSHEYVVHKAAEYLKADLKNLRIISCHLGNGCSIAAVEFGKSVETSMGLSPIEGLVMGTRSGDLDPGLILFLQKNENWTIDELDTFLNKKCGLLGLSGKTNDMREIIDAATAGDEPAQLALAVFCHRLKKYIGAYAAVMGGVDAVIFTGGIGENSPLIRRRVCQRLDFIGIVSDDMKNENRTWKENGAILDFTDEMGRAKLLAIKTDEELAIAMHAEKIFQGLDKVNTIPKIPMAISARHVHLNRETLDLLFGKDFELTIYKPLSQPGQFAANETVTIVGPKNKYENVRILGPIRPKNQIEISKTDEFFLGIDAPIRDSGNVDGSAPGTIIGPKGTVHLKEGFICAWRHIHMSPDDAISFGVKDKDMVEVEIDDPERPLVFRNVLIRVSDKFKLEMHIDTDEANAAEVKTGEEGALNNCDKQIRITTKLLV